MKKKMVCALLVAVLLVGIFPNVRLTAKAESNLTSSDALVDLLKSFEGLSSVCVLDGTQRSVGYGTRCDACDERRAAGLDPNYPYTPCATYTASNPITVEHATYLMRRFLVQFETEVNAFANRHGLTFTQQQFDALVSFTYNCGAGWTRGYGDRGVYVGDDPYALHNALIAQDHAKVAYAICNWKTYRDQVPSLGHVYRRMLELQVYFQGEYWSGGYKYGKWPENTRYVCLDGNGGKVTYMFHAFDVSQPTEIFTQFLSKPAHQNPDNTWTEYEFAGWFTERIGGTQVTELNGEIPRGTTLYAHWKDSAGNIVSLNYDAPTEYPVNAYATVTAWGSDWEQLSIYEHPGMQYKEVRRANHGDQLHITKVAQGYNNYKELVWFGFCGDGWVKLSKTNYQPNVTPEPEVPDTTPGTWYTVTATALNVRTSPMVSNSNSTGSWKYKNERIKIVTTQTSSNGVYLWGQMDNGYWICLKENGDSYAVADGSVVTPSPTPPEVKYTVTFRNWDNVIISSNTYVSGASVVIPGNPTRPQDKYGEWEFTGWDKQVTACTGDAVYTAQYRLKYAFGDIDRNGVVNDDDVIFLLYHIVYPEQYQIYCAPDFDHNGSVNDDDVIYLLYHLVYPDQYPLSIL